MARPRRAGVRGSEQGGPAMTAPDPLTREPLTMSAERLKEINALHGRNLHEMDPLTDTHMALSEVLDELDATSSRLQLAEQERDRLTAGLESIVALCTHEDAEYGTVFSPGGMQASIVLKGSNRPLERVVGERDAARA